MSPQARLLAALILVVVLGVTFGIGCGGRSSTTTPPTTTTPTPPVTTTTTTPTLTPTSTPTPPVTTPSVTTTLPVTTPTPTPPDTPKLPKSGEWTASVEFGEFVLTVNPSGTGISKISYNFVAFECGGVGMSGGVSIENPSLWLITDGQFTINNYVNPWDMVIQGEFDETGTHASGTWEITGATCSGTWESSPAS